MSKAKKSDAWRVPSLPPSDPSAPDYGRIPLFQPGVRAILRAARRHVRPSRLPTWAFFGTAYSSVVGAVNGGFQIDDQLYPEWRNQPIDEPVFIIGNARSGTTMLHRLLSIDEETFSGMRLYQSALNNVSVQRGLQALGRADARTKLQPGRRFVDLINRSFFGGWDGIHKLGIDQHEEDEATWAMPMTSITVNLLIPYTDDFAEMRFFDQLPVEYRAKFMDFYEASIKRHLYACAPNKHFLNKNVFFTPRVRSVIDRIPSARFLYLVRHPYDALPSFLSMWWEKWVSHTPEIRKDGPEARALARLAFDYYDYALALLDDYPDHFHVVRYDDLTGDPDEEVKRIYEWLELPMSESFRQELYDFTHQQRDYASVHEYTLEDFGFTKAEVYAAAKPFFERFGYER